MTEQEMYQSNPLENPHNEMTDFNKDHIFPDPLDNKIILEKFVQGMEEAKKLSSTSIKNYKEKLESMSKHVSFFSNEPIIIEHLQTVENPNTRSNKTSSIVKLRQYFNLPVDNLTSFLHEMKAEIRQHRKTNAKKNMESLCDYDTLIKGIDKLTGVNYYMNHMFANYGLRNRDINVIYKPRMPKDVTENTLVCNFGSKKPKMTFVIVDYKTAKHYGPKKIVSTSQRLFDELKSLNIKPNTYVFKKADNTKPSDNYMNVLVSRNSFNKYGEGKIAKILIKHLIDTKQFDKIEEMGKYRGTALSTLYTSYNVFDNK